MSDPLKNFLNVLDNTDSDKILLEETQFAKNTLQKLERVSETIIEFIKPDKQQDKKTLQKPSGITPEYRESVLEPKQSSTIYEVTNNSDKLPVVTKQSKLFDKIKYSFKDIGVAASVVANDKAYSLIAGEKFGFDFSQKQNNVRTNFQATYNIINQKAELKFTERNKAHTFRASLFNKDGINGGTVFYKNNQSGINSAFSVDRKSASLKIGLEKELKTHDVELNAFISKGQKYTPTIGVCGRIVIK